jgi:hypothetical protein
MSVVDQIRGGFWCWLAAETAGVGGVVFDMGYLCEIPELIYVNAAIG